MLLQHSVLNLKQTSLQSDMLFTPMLGFFFQPQEIFMTLFMLIGCNKSSVYIFQFKYSNKLMMLKVNFSSICFDLHKLITMAK